MKEDSYVPLLVLALGVVFYAWVSIRPDFLTRSYPLTLPQRIRASILR